MAIALRTIDRGALVESRALVSPTPLLLVAIASAVFAGVFWHPRAYVIGAVLATLLVAGFAIPVVSVRSCRATLRSLRSRGRVGEPLAAEVRVQGSRWLPLRGLSFAPGRDAAWAPRSEVAIAALAPMQSQAVGWTVVPTRRGAFPSGSLEVSCSAPFRALTGRRLHPPEPGAIVWPETVDLLAMEHLSAASGPEGALRLHAGGVDGDIAGPRAYRPGEPARRVHWPQSIRRGQLIVCEREIERGAAASLVLELAPQGAAADEAVEAAVSVVASLAIACSHAPGGVTVTVTGGRSFCCQDATGLRPLMDCLATVEPPEIASIGRPPRAIAAERAIVVTTDHGRADRSGDTLRIVVVDPDGTDLVPSRGDLVVAPKSWREDVGPVWERVRG